MVDELLMFVTGNDNSVGQILTILFYLNYWVILILELFQI